MTAVKEEKKDLYDGAFTHNIDINDLRNRYLITKGSTQQEVSLGRVESIGFPPRTDMERITDPPVSLLPSSSLRCRSPQRPAHRSPRKVSGYLIDPKPPRTKNPFTSISPLLRRPSSTPPSNASTSSSTPTWVRSSRTDRGSQRTGRGTLKKVEREVPSGNGPRKNYRSSWRA